MRINNFQSKSRKALDIWPTFENVNTDETMRKIKILKSIKQIANGLIIIEDNNMPLTFY